MFLWSLWWIRHALIDLGQSPYHCDYIFHPIGADLYLHTLTPLRGLLALPLTPLVGTVAAHNLIFLASFVLAGIGMLGLARHLGRSRAASFLAGLVYSFCHYHLARGYGHFNLSEIQWFPLYFVCLVRAVEERSRAFAAGAGLFLLAAAGSDHYYLVYALVLTAVFIGHRWSGRIDLGAFLAGAGTPAERRLRSAALGIAAIVLGLLVAGGVRIEQGPLFLSIRRLDRLLVLLGLMLVARAVLRARRLARAPGPIEPGGRDGDLGRDLRVLAAIALILVVGLAPVLVGIAGAASDDPALLGFNRRFSRTYAANVQGFLLPGVRDFDRGQWLARRWPPSLHLERSGIEGRNYLGLVPLALACAALGDWRRERWIRFHAIAALVFANLALGPSLHVGGLETWIEPPRSQLMLYNWLVRLPLVAGARVPSRFTILVVFCLAVLAAFGVDRLRRGLGRRGPFGRQFARLLPAAVLVVLAADLYPGRFAVLPIVVPAGYDVIAADPVPGPVLDLPLTWGSGVTGFGADSQLSLFYQTVHGRPVFSGLTSRLPERTFDQLFALPLVGSAMRIQLGCPVPPELLPEAQGAARGFAERVGLRYAVLHPAEPDPEGSFAAVAAYLDDTLDWQEVYRDERTWVWRRRE
jgi:hypothetical protein